MPDCKQDWTAATVAWQSLLAVSGGAMAFDSALQSFTLYRRAIDALMAAATRL